jgi:hypothetical protein
MIAPTLPASHVSTQATASTAPASPALPVAGPPQAELDTLRGSFLDFGGKEPTAFRQQQKEWLESYLEQGLLELERGPVYGVVETATDGDGVEEDKITLRLEEDAVVFGFLNCHGSGDTFYVFREGESATEYFSVTIESGVETGGPYDIYVSEAWTWEEFKQQLPDPKDR